MASAVRANNLIARALARRSSFIQVRNGGGGGPVASSKPPAEPLPEGDELVWDDGTVNPEPCLDQFTLVSKNQALGMLLAGLGGYAALGYALTLRDKASQQPYIMRKVLDEGSETS